MTIPKLNQRFPKQYALDNCLSLIFQGCKGKLNAPDTYKRKKREKDLSATNQVQVDAKRGCTNLRLPNEVKSLEKLHEPRWQRRKMVASTQIASSSSSDTRKIANPLATAPIVLLLSVLVACGGSAPQASTAVPRTTAVPTAVSHHAVLAWDPSASEPDIGGYNVYRRLNTDAVLSLLDATPTGVWKYTDTRVTAGMTYCWCVTAYLDQLESAPTTEVCATIPSP